MFDRVVVDQGRKHTDLISVSLVFDHVRQIVFVRVVVGFVDDGIYLLELALRLLSAVLVQLLSLPSQHFLQGLFPSLFEEFVAMFLHKMAPLNNYY